MRISKLPAWSGAAQAALAPALGDDREALIRGVAEGRLELWRLDGGAAHMITCVDTDLGELIVCCVAGRNLRGVSDAIWRIARSDRLRGVRFFSTNPAVARLIAGQPARYPLQLLGYVYRCEVPRVSQ